MQVTKKDLEKSQIELTVELSSEEFAPYIEKGAQKVSEEVKIEGFRKGKVPMDILKQKIGEMTILEEAANIGSERGCDYFTTTLSISPYKNAQKLNEIGIEMEEKYGKHQTWRTKE